jgi:hypothetical protein
VEAGELRAHWKMTDAHAWIKGYIAATLKDALRMVTLIPVLCNLVRRVQQLVKEGRLPAKLFGGSLMIEEKDLKLVATVSQVDRED